MEGFCVWCIAVLQVKPLPKYLFAQDGLYGVRNECSISRGWLLGSFQIGDEVYVLQTAYYCTSGVRSCAIKTQTDQRVNAPAAGETNFNDAFLGFDCGIYDISLPCLSTVTPHTSTN